MAAKRFGAIEAAIKFAITATIGAAIFLLGIALIIQVLVTYIPQIVNQLQTNVHSIPFLVYIGIGLIIAGIAFDITIVPFHTWLLMFARCFRSSCRIYRICG